MGKARRRGLGLLLVTCLGLAAAGSATTTTAGPGVRVVVPGRPGEQAAVSSGNQVKAPPRDSYSATDTWFVSMMIPHHRQAIDMASLAADRAHRPQIAAIAARMKAAQLPEILQFEAWLGARGLAETADSHDHSTMPGMQTPEAMRALANARGEQFDRMFVDMMSAHHRGAIEMAELRLRAGGDLMVEKMAGAIAFEQSVEIDRMRDILAQG